jgi:hypothetical protein
MKGYFKIFTPALVVIIAATFTYTGVVSALATTGSPACGNSLSKKAISVGLGRASDMSVLAGSAITNVGTSYANGYIGVTPGTAITGIESIISNTNTNPVTVATRIYSNVETLAKSSLIITNDSITAQSLLGFSPVVAQLGSQTVCPGIYKSDAAFGLTGILTLDGNNDPNSVFIFITPAAFTSAAASKIILRNGAAANNVFWKIGAAATLGASSFFKGTLLTEAAITVGNGVHVHGRLLSKSAAITLDRDCILMPGIRVTIPCTEE